MKKLTKYIFITCLLSSNLLFGQQELGLHFNRNVWQANHTNPALVPDYKTVIALPSIYGDFSLGGATYGDLVERKSTGKTTIGLAKLINALPTENALRNTVQFDLLGVGFRVKKVFVSLGASGQVNNYLGFPKELLDVAVNGNAKFIGKTADLSLRLENYAMSEKFLGVAYNINDKLTVAGKARLLAGQYCISSNNSNMSLYTDPDIYQLTLKSDLRINTSGVADYKGYDKANPFHFETYLPSFDTTAKARAERQTALITTLSGGANKGFALDLGLNYKINEKLNVAASITGLGGKINWKNQTTTFAHNGLEYKGLDFGVIIRGDTSTFNKVMDTLVNQLDLAPTTHDAFSTKIPMRTYLSATYRLNKTLQLGGLFFTENHRGKTTPSFALSANTFIGWLNLGVAWSYRDKSAKNLGMSAVADLGPIQIFGMTDNILPVFNVDNNNLSYNGRVGINLMIGKPKKAKKVPTPTETAPVPETPIKA